MNENNEMMTMEVIEETWKEEEGVQVETEEKHEMSTAGAMLIGATLTVGAIAGMKLAKKAFTKGMDFVKSKRKTKAEKKQEEPIEVEDFEEVEEIEND